MSQARTPRKKGATVKRLGTIDRVLLFTVLPIWAFWFALYIYNLAHGRIASLGIWVSAPQSPDNYPIVLGILGTPSAHGLSTSNGLEVGDRLLRIGQAGLKGVWPVGFLARRAMAIDASLRVRLVFVRAGHHHEVLLPLFRDPYPWVFAIIIISFVGMALLLLMRKPNSRLMQANFLASIVFAFRITPIAEGPPIAPLALIYAWAGLVLVSDFVTFPLWFRVLQLFPEDAMPASARLSK